MNALNWKIAGQSAILKEGKAVKDSAIFRLDLAALKKKREALKDNRVIYARKAGEEFGSAVDSGEKITQETASQLKLYAWGSANMPPKTEWLKQGLTFHPQENIFAYGLATPKNGTRNFIMCLQAFFLKHLLFEKKGGKVNREATNRIKSRRNQAIKDGNAATARKGSFKLNQLLKPNEKSQCEMMIGGLTEILFRVAEGKEAVFCVPGPENCFEPSAHYGIDGVTEKLRIFKCKKEDDIRSVIKRCSATLMAENGTGLLCVLYSIMLSRNFKRLVEDMQDQAENSLVDPMGDCSQALLNLVVVGTATPYLHNGTIFIDDEETQEGKERIGVCGRNDIGFLLWDRDQIRTDRWQLGSRLKTPTLPMWITKVNGNYGVLFNPNRELMRSYSAENRFQLYYYSNFEFKKEERKETILTIDTRTKALGAIVDNNLQDDGDDDDVSEPPLQLAIKTKWEGAEIDWHGVHPYV